MISWFSWNFWKIKQFSISNRCTIYPNFRLKSNFPWLIFTRFLRWKCQCNFTLILTFPNQIWIRLKPSLELELNLSELLKTNHYCLFLAFSASEKKCRKYASTPGTVFWGRPRSYGGSGASKSPSARLRLEAPDGPQISRKKGKTHSIENKSYDANK